jgi:hypothetical protein
MSIHIPDVKDAFKVKHTLGWLMQIPCDITVKKAYKVASCQ